MGMVSDALRNATAFHAIVCFIADAGLKEPTDFGGSPFFLSVWDGRS